MQIKSVDMLKKLEKSGFSDKEALVYTSLLELGGAYPSRIAEYAGLKRSTVYNVLLNLSIRGLVNEIEKRSKLFYQIDKPEKIVRFAKDQITLAEDKLEKAKSILPDIEGLYSAFADRPQVKYFEGTEGVMAIYSDMIQSEKKYEMLAFSNAAQLENIIPEKFFERFRRTKERAGITTRGIVPDTEIDRAYNDKFFKGYKPEIVPKFKYVPEAQFPFKGEITVYGENKISIINLSKEHLTGIIVEDEAIHGMMKMIFEMSWSSSLVKN